MKLSSAPVVRSLTALAFTAAFALTGVASHAQAPVAPAPPQAPPVASAAVAKTGEYPKVSLTAGRSTVLATAFNISRIAITNPAIADATVVAPREILIDGKAPGTISLIVWGPDSRSQYDLVVEQPVTPLQQNLQMLFPGEDIQVSTTDDSTILSGQVSSTNVMLRAGEIATASAAKRAVINLLQVPGGNESQQVLLQVRFAEVNRRVLQELGVNFFLAGSRFSARASTQQFAGAEFDDASGGLAFSDFLNLFFFDRKEGIGGLVRALENRGAFQSLAEPNLIAYNNQEASFLAGGEFPVPVVQGSTGTVSIIFKEFGIRLSFKPTIAGDAIRLKVKPEVSALDFANGVSLGGFRIPALTTRRAETDVELRDGQSFAIAGLLNNISQEDRSAMPLLSKLPIIGSLFKTKSERAEQTELMVLITPRLVRPLDPDEVPPLPTRFKPFMSGDKPGPGGPGGEFEGTGSVDAPDPKPIDGPAAKDAKKKNGAK
ncbi:MAG: type II and III secretion system protein family protein [Vicinamibacterales bacterium]